MRGRKMVGNNRRGKHSYLPFFFGREGNGRSEGQNLFSLVCREEEKKGKDFFLFNLFSGWEDLLYC
jgi:hypothetical protein